MMDETYAKYVQRFGEIIKVRRKALGYSPEYVAGVEMSVRTLFRTESGKYFPTLDKLTYLCNKLMLELSDLLRQIVFFSSPIRDIDPIIIHRYQFTDDEKAEIREILEMLFESNFRRNTAYSASLELLYFSMYFEVPVYLAECIEKVEYLLHKKESLLKLEAEFLGAIIKRNYNQELTETIMEAVWNGFSKKAGSKLPIMYSACIYHYRRQEWDKIITLTTKVLDAANFYNEDTNYLPHMYAQRGIARLERDNDRDNPDLQTARVLCNLLGNKDMLQFLDGYQKITRG